ncbi:Disease resistance protein (TIR-NBS-LRR class) family [Arabidopsis thaliana]|uniref:ADP-ribosyl cyclase/cyclic ADP-ribose hydrolase n=1 Tax=Arabidopsis thaliana TaxID=3702 RepID=A0A1P8B3F0_ARATH|nr:Disease resistance protein (TIR-NBS-LRR class) family [Arabidopsis thaliana]ANM66105.1 Disease resistance protein (TIR-NBS-LRR class) family [Arabidopsis thaliana]|eukprot:NP_001328021.1 Disease resistance protein (TIR-NBS-LRR class) family [Arabidopsis thaliana]
MAASSSSGRRRYDVFPSFSGVDVRKTFLSHLIEALDGKSINTFIDHGIERSRTIAPELISAIREARISIVIFSKNYASSTWCLNELVEIHKCFNDLGQMVIPVFYDVDPSEVRKQTGEFGKVFEKTCEVSKDKQPGDQKQRWVQALTDIANIAGEDLLNGPNEAHMVEKISNDVSNKLITRSKCFDDFVGIEAHIEAIKSVLCLESKEARMVGIWGQSGIGKSTIGRALFSQLSIQFPLRAFLTYKSTSGSDVSGMKLSWEKELLSEILGQKDIKIEHFGVVEQRLKHKKVLILLDDVDNLEFLKTLVGKAEWFGSGSRIIVITQDRQFLKAHDIDLVYEVKLPSQGLALTMLCRSAFGKDSPPDDFKELAFEVAKLAGHLPLGLNVLGSSLRRRGKKEWMEMMPRLRNGLNGDIMKTLRVSYDRLHQKDQDMFLCIACLFNGFEVSYVKDLLEDNVGLTMLSEKSLIRITPDGHIEMHNLLEKLGREIDRAKSKGNPGKRQFLTNFEDIHEVVTEKTGTETLLGIRLPFEEYFSTRPLLIDKESFKGMRNLQYLKIGDWSDGGQPQSLVYLPLKLRLLDWDDCPLKSLPSTFKAEYLVNLIMKYSKLEKLWEGTLPLGSLKKMNLLCSKNLKEIPDLSNARNLEELDLEGCESLVTLPSSIQNAIKLRKLHCSGVILIDLKSLEGMCNLEYLSVDCSRVEGTQGIVYFPSKLRLLLWNNCPLKRLHSNFKVEYLVKLRMENSDLEKLWDGTQPLGRLKQMFLRGSKYLKEIPDLSLAINLEEVDICKCESLVTFPSSMQNAIKLIYLDISDCKKLESFPTDLNLESLEYLNLTGCPNLRNFPAIKMGCSDVDFPEGRNEIVVEDCFWNKNLPAGLDYLDCLMRCMPCEFRPEYLVFLNVRCYKHEKLWEGIQSLGSLEEMDLSESENLTEIPDLSKATKLESLILNNCKSLVTLPSTIGNLQNLRRLYMKRCTGLEVLPTDVNLSSLGILDLSGCSSLRTFPLISTNIVWLYLENTAIGEVPCCIEDFTRLRVLLMYCCQRLKNISPNIFRLRSLMFADFTDCRGVIKALSDATVVATMEDSVSCVPLSENIEYTCERFWGELYGDGDWDLGTEYFSFRNCFKLDRDARELILRSCFKPVALPGGEIPKYFTYRAYGDSLTVTLPRSSLSQSFLRFKACLVVDPLSEGKGFYRYLEVNFGFNGKQYQKSFLEDEELEFCKTDHLFFCSFKFESEMTFNDVEFKFCCSNRIKECGVRLMYVSQETEYNQQTTRSKKRMRMTSGTSEEYINLAGDQIVADTGLAALNMELSLGEGEASSSTSLEGEALSVDYMITKEQDEDIPFLDPVSDGTWRSFYSAE